MITVITGPPCAGKTTYVRGHAKFGDTIVDFDAIARALGSLSSHHHEWQLREITAAAWNAAVTTVLDQAFSATRDAWIIDAQPTQGRLARYSEQRATVAQLNAPRDELHRRATTDGRPPEAHLAIDRWFADAEPAPRPRTAW